MRVSFLALWVVMLLATSTFAVMVTKGGETLLSDDFEGVAVGSTPDNGAAPGEWGTEVYGNNTWVKVVDDPMPGPYQGSQYVSLVRGKEPPGSEAFLYGDLGVQSSGLLRVDFMMYIPSQAGLPAILNLSGGTMGNAFDQRVVWMAAWTDNNVKYHSPSTGWTNTGVTYARDVWQRWEIELDLGTSDLDFTDAFTVAVDGLKSAAIPVAQERSVRYLNFRCGSGDGSSFYLDAVPEPASLTLLAMGAWAILRRRR